MKKSTLIVAAMAASCWAAADEWQKPVYSGPFQPLTEGDTVLIYNTESRLFLTEGNDWGTHATVGDTGLLFIVNKHSDENAEWDGKTYTIWDYSVAKDAWKQLFITDAGNVYVDLSNQEDYYFSFKDLGGNTYQIYGADKNPVWNTTGEDREGYVIGHYTEYTNSKDAVFTGTGVIFDDAGADTSFEPGTFLTSWAFVSQEDYAAYLGQMDTYNAATMLGELIEEAESMEMSGIDEEKAAYANTSSTKEALDAAYASLSNKMLAYYEVYITPDNPKELFTDDGSSIEDWTNNLNVDDDQWVKTGTWVGDGWEEEAFTGTYHSIWSANMEGSAYVELEDIPNGIYVVRMSIFSESMDGYVFANENTKTVSAAAPGKMYEITTRVAEGSLSFGFGQEKSGTNWIVIDNVSVSYYGTGTEAYKYWLKNLSESAPSFDDAVAQDVLIDEYNKVMEVVKAASTDEEILSAIKVYEDILDRITVNMAAYEALSAAISDAEEMTTDESINEYYGNKLSDAIQEMNDIVEEHKLGTEDVEAKAAELSALVADAQGFIWAMQDLASTVERVEAVYLENKETCSVAAAEAYTAYMEKYNSLDKSMLTTEDVKSLEQECWNIEFNLTVPEEPASDENPIDYTAKIYNPGFYGTDGWTNDGWATFENHASWSGFENEDGPQPDTYYLNIWNISAASFSQTVTNLPAGAYKVTVMAFADAEGFEIFANDNTVEIPAGRSDGDAGSYMRPYTIQVVVGEEGTLTIGARNTSDSTVWAMIDEFKLEYCGTESEIMTGISSAHATSHSSTAIHSLTGVKVGNSLNGLSKGLYIQNGKKFIVK